MKNWALPFISSEHEAWVDEQMTTLQLGCDHAVCAFAHRAPFHYYLQEFPKDDLISALTAICDLHGVSYLGFSNDAMHKEYHVQFIGELASLGYDVDTSNHSSDPGSIMIWKVTRTVGR